MMTNEIAAMLKPQTLACILADLEWSIDGILADGVGIDDDEYVAARLEFDRLKSVLVRNVGESDADRMVQAEMSP